MRTQRLSLLFAAALGGVFLLTNSPAGNPLYRSELPIDHYIASDSIRMASDENPNKSRLLTSSPPSLLNYQKIVNFHSSEFSSYSVNSVRPPLETKLGVFQNPHLYPTNPVLEPTPVRTDLTLTQNRVSFNRATVSGIGNAAAIFFGFKHTTILWGKSNGRFHIKDDWTGDHLAQTDEISHFMWGYKMTQFFFSTYHWTGLSPHTGELLSMVESALILTAVEYPVDAYNPKQGLGVSDLIFDYMGVGLAYAKKHNTWLGNLDFKISWKRNIFIANHSAFAQTYADYDNTIYWLTCRASLIFPRKIVCWGLGYSTTHVGIEPKRQFYLGVGLSMSDFAGLFGKKLKKPAGFLDLFYPNLRLKL